MAYIRMSKEQTKAIDGSFCSNVLSNLKEEFDRKAYLRERYLRTKDLEKIRKQNDVTKMELICAFEKYITDIAVGYFIGKQPTYYNKNKKEIRKRKTIFGSEKPIIKEKENISSSEEQKNSEEFISFYENLRVLNHDAKENIRMVRNSFITSNSYEYIYTNEDGDIRYKMIDGDCVIIKSDDVESKTIGFIRRYNSNYYKVENGKLEQKEEEVIELLTLFKRVYYRGSEEFEKEYNLMREGTKPFNDDWEIPIVEMPMPEGLGLFEQQISEIRGYELVSNNTKKILNYNDDAILMISGVMFLDGEDEEKINEIIERYRKQGVIFTGNNEDGGEAKWLTKQVNDQTNQKHKENLKNDIYGIAGLFNPENDSQVYQNTLSLIFKLYGLETKMSEFEETFKDSMKRRIKIITQIENAKEGKKYNWMDFDLTMFRNLPTNTNEELNFVNQARDILPLKKIYEELSFVNDAEEMLQLYEQDQIRQAKLDAKIQKIYQEESSVNDIESDNTIMKDEEKNGTVDEEQKRME